MLSIIKYIIYPFFVLFITLFTLEQFYIFPINISLDIKPEGKRTAVYLVKTIFRKSNCDYQISLFEEVFNIDKPREFACNIGNASFTIFIFYNKQEKYNLVKKVQEVNKNDRLHTTCFKEGNYYIICENPSFGSNRYSSEPSLAGKILYNRFPGQDMKY